MRIYLVTPTGGTVQLAGPKRNMVADFLVRQFQYRICTYEEWKAARKKQQAEEYGRIPA